MKNTLFIMGLILTMAGSASATIIVQSHWRMGEEAGDTDGRMDSVGGRNFSVNAVPSEFIGDAAPSPNGSTHAASVRDSAGRAGYFGPNTTTFMPADNWGVEFWARSANVTQTIDIFEVQGGGPVTGNLKIGQFAGNWGASYHGLGWIGADTGAGQPASAETWTHLAVVRETGTTSFYINGQAQAGTSPDVPVWGNSLHLGVRPGGATGWNGDVDEVRAFTFNPGAFDPNNDLLFAIPEPRSFLLVLLGAAPLIHHMRRRRNMDRLANFNE